MQKLQITLTEEESKLLAARASLLGYNVTKYAKFVLTKEAMEAIDIVATFKASPKMEKSIKEALEEYKAGKTFLWPE